MDEIQCVPKGQVELDQVSDALVLSIKVQQLRSLIIGAVTIEKIATTRVSERVSE